MPMKFLSVAAILAAIAFSPVPAFAEETDGGVAIPELDSQKPAMQSVAPKAEEPAQAAPEAKPEAKKEKPKKKAKAKKEKTAKPASEAKPEAKKEDAKPLGKYDSCAQSAESDPVFARLTAEKWLDEDKSNVGAHHCLALSLYSLKEYEKAAEEFEKTAETLPENESDLKVGILRQAAASWAGAGNLQSGYDSLTKAYGLLNSQAQSDEQKKELKGVLLERAEIALKLGKSAESIQDTDQVLQLDAENAEARILRSQSLRIRNDFEGALKETNQALKSAPKNASAFYERAEIYFAQGKEKEAKDDLKKVTELAPGSAIANRAKAKL